MEDEIPATGHTGVVDEAVAATCTTTGLTEGWHCSVCNEVIKAQEEIPMLEHDLETIEGYPATCTEEGLEDGERCSRCGAEDGFAVIMPLLHDWENYYTVDQEATCTTDGSKSIYCSRCDATMDTQVIPATGHTAVVDEAVAATCTETGLTEGCHCSVCDEVIVEQEVVPALGHTMVIDEAVAATCTENGLTEGSHCSVCEVVIKAQEIIPAAHTLTHTETKAATCTEAGNNEYYSCSVCSKVFKDVECSIETTVEAEVISANGHTLKNVAAKDPTCTEDGNTEHYKCSVCNAVFSDANGESETTIEAVTLPATGHFSENVEAKAATCIENGLTEGSKCSVCDAILSGCEEIPALGHDYQYQYIDDQQHLCTCSRGDFREEEGHNLEPGPSEGGPDLICVCGYSETFGTPEL